MFTSEAMKIRQAPEPYLEHPAGALPVPAQAEMILSAIETGQYTRRERRCAARAAYRVQATLKLFSDQPNTPAWTLFTRDVNSRGLGFITTHRLPLGYGGLLEIMVPSGDIRTIACTLLRCREASPGWYEGSMYFNRQQADFLL